MAKLPPSVGRRPSSAATRSLHARAAPHRTARHLGYMAGSSGTRKDDDRDAEAATNVRRTPDAKNKNADTARCSSLTSPKKALQSRLQRSRSRLKRTRTNEAARDAAVGTEVHAEHEDGHISMLKRIRKDETAHAAASVDNAADNIYIQKIYTLLSDKVQVMRPAEHVTFLRTNGCIIFEEKDPDCILGKINDLLSLAAHAVLQGSNYSFKVQLFREKDVIYEDGYGFAHKAGRSVTYDFSRKNILKTTILNCVLAVIAEAIKEGITITSRDVFYRYRDIFGSKRVSDAMIFKVCCMFNCIKSSLNVVSEVKGSVAACHLNFVLKNGQTVSSVLDGQRIPNNLSVIQSFQTKAEYILVLEKKSVFHHLVQMKHHVTHRCIIIAGSGYPDIATRSFLKRLHTETQLPVYGLFDPDPHGIQILFVYAFGSKNMSPDRMGLAVPAIRWTGLFIEDMEGLRISDSYFSSVTKAEKKMLNELLTNKIMPFGWSHRIRDMLDRGRKASIEALQSLGLSVMSKVLPELRDSADRAHDNRFG